MRRDDEIQRLIRYAQGMGLSVYFKPYVNRSNNQAEWATDGSEITIFVSPRTSKIEKVISLIHELGHQKYFIDKGRKADPKFEAALDSEEKKHRKRVLEFERVSTVYWEDIYRDTNCTFNIKRLYLTRELDIWVYEVYHETGKWPTEKEKNIKLKDLKEKYNG
jgi:hypothetical protein